MTILSELAKNIIVGATTLITGSNLNISSNASIIDQEKVFVQDFNRTTNSAFIPKLVLGKPSLSGNLGLVFHRSHRSHSSHRSHYSSRTGNNIPTKEETGIPGWIWLTGGALAGGFAVKYWKGRKK